MRFKIKAALLIIGIIPALIFFSCSKETDYSVIPVIEFRKIELLKYQSSFRDSAVKITISFIDGDGDLGLTQQDTFAPYNPGSVFYNNYYAYYYELYNGDFIQVRPEIGGIPFGDTIRYTYRFPDMRSQSNNKALRGEIDLTIRDMNPVKSNTIKLRIHIYDRSLNKSNIIETTPFTYTP